MKINIALFARELKEKGFSSINIDSEDLTNTVLEMLGDKNFFVILHEELLLLEEGEPKSLDDYLEKIGEV